MSSSYEQSIYFRINKFTERVQITRGVMGNFMTPPEMDAMCDQRNKVLFIFIFFYPSIDQQYRVG